MFRLFVGSEAVYYASWPAAKSFALYVGVALEDIVRVA